MEVEKKSQLIVRHDLMSNVRTLIDLRATENNLSRNVAMKLSLMLMIDASEEVELQVASWNDINTTKECRKLRVNELPMIKTRG